MVAMRREAGHRRVVTEEPQGFRPCPFCGQLRTLSVVWTMHAAWVECSRCDSSGPLFKIQPESRDKPAEWRQGATKRWNERN